MSTSLLRKKGYKVDVANNGQEAVDLLKGGSYELVLMDVQMPVLDGLAATQRIRADNRLASLPIIAMTAHAMNGDRERCLMAGMNEYLAKPVDHKHLLGLIEQYLHQHPPSATAVAVNPPLDSRLNGADPALVGQMHKLFVQLAPDRVKRMQQAASEGNLATLREDTQKLQGAARSISAAAVVQWAESLDEAAGRADLEAVRSSLSHLDEEIRALAEPEPQPSGF